MSVGPKKEGASSLNSGTAQSQLGRSSRLETQIEAELALQNCVWKEESR